MSVRQYQDCPTCGAELALRQMFLPGLPDDQFVWWDRCTNCGRLLIQPSKAIAASDDDRRITAEFGAAIREYEQEEARATYEAIHNPKPCGTVPTDGQHRCINCAYVCRKGMTTQAGLAIALWCGYRNEYICDWKGRRVLNPDDDSCPDWFPFEEAPRWP